VSRKDIAQFSKRIVPNKDSEFIRLLDQALDVGVSILDENLIYQYIGREFYNQIQLHPSELNIGDPLSKTHELMKAKGLLTDDIVQKHTLSPDEHLNAKDAELRDMRRIVHMADGSTHRLHRQKLDNGYTVSISHNITNLIEKERLLEDALRLGSSGYWIYDFAKRGYEFSDTLMETFSKADQDLIETIGIIAIVHPEDRPLFLHTLENIDDIDGIFDITCRAVLEEQEIWIRNTGQIIKNEKGKLSKIRAFVMDVTDDRKLAIALEEAKNNAIAASNAKTIFLANMSHEIRTPMNGVLGMAELLATTEINDQQREYINVINSSASTLLTIINDILDFSKVEAGELKLDPVTFNLKQALSDMAALLTSQCKKKGLELILSYPSDAEQNFYGDSARIIQILTNLVGNAIKFTETGHIAISVDVKEARNNLAKLTLSVTDTGIGIAKDQLETVFEKFTQADNSTTRVYGGTGLGLSISRHLTEMLGGKLSVKSQLGSGSTFTVSLTLPTDTEAEIVKYDPGQLSGKRVLIVDDISFNRTMLTDRLEAWGMRTTSVVDGIEALKELKISQDEDDTYDLILLDYLMPGMNGHELAGVISDSQTLTRPPMIMLSSCDQPVSSPELRHIGIGTYLVKPVREKRLFDSLLKTLSNPDLPEDRLPSGAHNPLYTPQIKDENDSRLTINSPDPDIDILVAEDIHINQDVIRLMLSDSKFRPVFAKNGLEAVNMYKSDPDRFALILMDISMPVMDGYEATACILGFEEDTGRTHTPIIAVTGHAMSQDQVKCLTAGMDDYLAKPIRHDALLAVMNAWLTKSPAVIRNVA